MNESSSSHFTIWINTAGYQSTISCVYQLPYDVMTVREATQVKEIGTFRRLKSSTQLLKKLRKFSTGFFRLESFLAFMYFKFPDLSVYRMSCM